MPDNHKQPQPEQEPELLHTLRINGKCPTQREAARIRWWHKRVLIWRLLTFLVRPGQCKAAWSVTR